MAKLELWTGLPRSGRGEEAAKRVVESVRQGGDVWWITDAQRHAQAQEARFLAALDGALAGVEIITAGQLPLQLFQAAGRTVPTLAAEVREIVFRELLEDRSGKGSFPVSSSEGWARKAVEFYLRLQAGDEILEKHLRVRYPWVFELIHEYRERLADSGLMDESELPRIALELLRESSIHVPTLIVMDRLGPHHSPVQNLLHAFARFADSTIVIVDFVPEAGPALALSRTLREEWMLEEEIVERPFAPDTHTARLAQTLFGGPTGPRGELELAARVVLSHYPDRTAEVRSTAALLAKRVYEEKIDPSSTAVICTRLEDYEALVRELFPRYGLMPDIRLGPRLDTNPVAKVVMGLFELRHAGLSRERITDLLLNPYVRWGKTLSQNESVLSFDSAARQARIRDQRGSFREVWQEPLEHQVRRLEERARELELNMDEDGETSGRARSNRLHHQADEVRTALSDLLELNNRIGALPDPCTVSEALDWLDGLLSDLGVVDAVNRTARRDPQLGGDDLRALGHLRLTLQHVATSLVFHGRKQWPVSRFAETLRFALRTARLKPSARLRGGIQIAGPLELRGLRVRELFFLGLTADSWPRSPELDLADPFGARWSQVDRLAESRSLTFEALLSSERLTLSTPTPQLGEGREAPSPLLAEVRAAGVKMEESEKGDGTLRSTLEALPEIGRLLAESRNGVSETLLHAFGEAHLPIEGETVRRTVAVEQERLAPETLSIFEGYLAGTAMADLVGSRTLARPLSATRLDSYAQCPMQFFLGHVLEVSPLEEVEEELEPRHLGGAVHEILARTVVRLRNIRGGDPDLSENVPEVAVVMEDVARSVLPHFVPDNLYGDMVTAGVLSGLTRADEPVGRLRAMINKNEKDLSGNRVHLVEASFGLPVEAGETRLLDNPIRVTDKGITLELVGRIDRVDLHPEKGWRIFDYKLSNRTQPSAAVTKNGLSFQLPVYTWALEQWLAENSSTVVFDFAKYFQVKENSATISTGWKASDQNEASRDLMERVVTIHEAIRAGRFHHPLSADRKLCDPDLDHNYCPFKFICRRSQPLFERRPSLLRKEFLDGAYRLAFQQFAADEAGVNHA